MSNDYLDSVPDNQKFDYNLIRGKLEDLLDTFSNRIDRTTPLAHIINADHVVSAFVKLAKNIYKTIIFINATKPKDYARRKEYIFSSIPLLRVIVEELFTIVFLSEDFESRMLWYLRSGWREFKEEHDRLVKRHGETSRWKKILKELQLIVDQGKTELALTKREMSNIGKEIPRWPIPSRMAKHLISGTNREYFQYLNDWYYKQFSQSVHMTLPGLFQAEVYISLKSQNESKMEEYVEKTRFLCVLHATTLVLSLLTELNTTLGFQLHKRIAFLWGIIIQYSDDAAELYDLRYREVLQE